MKLLTYNDQEITLIESPNNPSNLVRLACETTMLKQVLKDKIYDRAVDLLEFVIKAEHTSVLEHVNFTFFIENVSRSFMAQITRHRICSFTIASQHYQDYRDYPMVIHPSFVDQFQEEWLEYNKDAEIHKACCLEATIADYTALIDHCKLPNYEARQILPNACAVNIMWTINARSLINFFRQRCCNRNTDEIKIFADNLKELLQVHWPEYAALVGAPCQTGECNQGKMACKESYHVRRVYR